MSMTSSEAHQLVDIDTVSPCWNLAMAGPPCEDAGLCVDTTRKGNHLDNPFFHRKVIGSSTTCNGYHWIYSRQKISRLHPVLLRRSLVNNTAKSSPQVGQGSLRPPWRHAPSLSRLSFKGYATFGEQATGEIRAWSIHPGPDDHYWWTKSCTSWLMAYPIISEVSYTFGHAGFRPSTVPLPPPQLQTTTPPTKWWPLVKV